MKRLRPNWPATEVSNERHQAGPAGDQSCSMQATAIAQGADQFARLAEEAVKEKQSHLSYLEALLEAEVEERDHRRVARRIQEAVPGGERRWRS